jgi:hypothetical protein
MSRGMDFWDVFTTQVEKNLFQKKICETQRLFSFTEYRIYYVNDHSVNDVFCLL